METANQLRVHPRSPTHYLHLLLSRIAKMIHEYVYPLPAYLWIYT